MKDNLKNIIIGLLLGVICVLIILILLVVNGTISLNFNNEDVVENIKVYDSKDYVYNAEYIYNNKYTEYGEGTGTGLVDRGISFEYNEGKQYLKDLNVPYIKYRIHFFFDKICVI